jgi:hypothetical protein
MSYETVNRPVEFPGTDEERRANRATHHFASYDHEEPPECMDCMARTYHVAADYPCGTEPPRETVVTPAGLTDAVLRMKVAAAAPRVA